MRKIALVFAALALAVGVLAGTAGANGGSQLHLLSVGACDFWSNVDNGSVDPFCDSMALPSSAEPGDTISVTVKAYAKVAESQNATVSFYGLGAAGLTIVGNGDGSAVQSGNSFAYTDYYYGGGIDGYANGKGDTYSFTVAADQAPGTYHIIAKVRITNDGYGGYTHPSSAWEVLTYTIPAPPEVNGQIDRTGFCTSTGQFLNLDFGSYSADLAAGMALTPSPWVNGVGLTCDTNGHTFTGSFVDGDTGTVNTTVADNIHPVYN